MSNLLLRNFFPFLRKEKKKKGILAALGLLFSNGIALTRRLRLFYVGICLIGCLQSQSMGERGTKQGKGGGEEKLQTVFYLS